MRQHYPDAEWREIFPAESEDGAGRCTDGTGSGESGVSEEETLIQNELLSSEHDREASLLEREQDDGGSAGKNMPEEKRGLYYVILAAFGVIVTAALLCGWMLLFGVRVYTRDASGRYRIAGVTRVASKEGGKQKTVPLTRQIIRNSETNDLRLRFGSLCLSRYGGEIMLLTYKTMSREFTVGRTVLLRMRA